MTGQSPAERFAQEAVGRPAPSMKEVEEYLRLRETRTVHRKLSTVEVAGQRFAVDAHPARAEGPGPLRSQRLRLRHHRLRRPGHRTCRAPQAGRGPGAARAGTPPRRASRRLPAAACSADHEPHRRAELAALRLQVPAAAELDLPGLVALLEALPGGDPHRPGAQRGRGVPPPPASPGRRRTARQGLRRRPAPARPRPATSANTSQALEAQLVRTRTRGRKRPPSRKDPI